MWSWKSSKVFIDKTIKGTSIMPDWRLLSLSTSVRNHKAQPQSTVDPSDVAVFSKQMTDWWNTESGGIFLLHKFNLLRVPFIRDGLVQCATERRHPLPLKDKKILDVGCGGGILSEGLARLGAEVTGLDASKELISIAEEHKNIDPKIANNRPTYVYGTIEEHSKFFPNHYDGVVASEVIEHVNHKDLFVKSCVETLKPGGKIFFTTPAKTRISQFLVIFMSENVLNLTPKGAHQYEKFITPNELTFLLERNNCHVEQSYGVIYNPVTKKWSFTKHQHFVYALQAAKLS